EGSGVPCQPHFIPPPGPAIQTVQGDGTGHIARISIEYNTLVNDDELSFSQRVMQGPGVWKGGTFAPGDDGFESRLLSTANSHLVLDGGGNRGFAPARPNELERSLEDGGVQRHRSANEGDLLGTLHRPQLPDRAGQWLEAVTRQAGAQRVVQLEAGAAMLEGEPAKSAAFDRSDQGARQQAARRYHFALNLLAGLNPVTTICEQHGVFLLCDQQ